MASSIYVFGHQNPDTDTVCSAVAYADLKRQLGYESVFAYRLGTLNKETQFALDYFRTKTPPLLSDVKVKLKDLGLYNPEPISRNDPVKKVWDVLKRGAGARLMPVVDEAGRFEGVISISDITKVFLELPDEDIVQRYNIRFSNLLKMLDGKLLHGAYNFESLCGAIYIDPVGENADLFTAHDVVITGGPNSARYFANETKCGCVILCNGVEPIEPEKSIGAIVSVDHTVFRTVGLVNQSISVSSVMKSKNMITFSTENYVEDIMDIMKSSSHRNFPVMDRTGRLAGVISRRHLMEHARKQVILVDHNEQRQSAEGIEEANILEIIDHHRIDDVRTDAPIYVRSEPVGSTATVIFKMYLESGKKPNAKIAGLLLSAILSDTLMFRSPTCTSEDRASSEKLAAIAQVNVETYGRAMFTAGMSLSDYSAEDIIAIDRKKFSFDKYTVYISQVNTLDSDTIADRKPRLYAAMEEFCEKHGCDLVLLMITDIVSGGTELLIRGKARELLTRAFGIHPEDDSVFLQGVVSRKKQIIPKLNMAIHQKY